MFISCRPGGWEGLHRGPGRFGVVAGKDLLPGSQMVPFQRPYTVEGAGDLGGPLL